MKKLNILHLNNVAQVGSILSKQQNQMKLNSEFIDLLKPFKNSSTILKILSSPIRISHALYLRAKISIGHYDIIHIHYTTSALLFLGIKPKLVVHAHGSDIRDQDKKKIHFFLNKLVFKHADLIFFSTPDLKRHMDKYHIPSTFVPNPLDIENFAETIKPELSLFIHASISEIKGAPILIKALKKIRLHYPNLKITYLAFGDMLEEIQQLNLNELSRIKREDLKDIISAHGLILGQFKVGAIGMSELEALACNRPVVCHFEYDHSYKTPPPLLKAQTAEEIFSHVEAYLQNPDSFLSNKYREWVVENHSKEKIERLVYDNYQSTLKKIP